MQAWLEPPTFDTATAGQRASMRILAWCISSCGNCNDSAGQPAHIHRRGAAHGRAVAQLTVAVVSPALDAAAGQRTGVR